MEEAGKQAEPGLAAIADAVLAARREAICELPPILSGLDATGIQEEARRAIDEVLGILHGTR